MKKILCLLLALCLLLTACGGKSERNKLEKMADELLASDIYENWMWVAECEESTAEILEDCAEKCASINASDPVEARRWAIRIAASLCNHPNADSKVAKELMKSPLYGIWKVIATSECNTEKTLVKLAKKCARTICNGDLDGNEMCEVAKALLLNYKATDDVAEALIDSNYFAVCEIVASADCNTERTLAKLAKKCATITDDNTVLSESDVTSGKGADDWAFIIAETIVNNSKATENVYIELLRSCYPEVRQVAFEQLGYTVPTESATALEEP